MTRPIPLMLVRALMVFHGYPIKVDKMLRLTILGYQTGVITPFLRQNKRVMADKLIETIESLRAAILQLNGKIVELETRIINLQQQGSASVSHHEAELKPMPEPEPIPEPMPEPESEPKPEPELELELEPEPIQSEYDLIPISPKEIADAKIIQMMQNHLERTIELKGKMKDVIDQRLQSTSVLDNRRRLMLSYNANDRNPEFILNKKLKILDELDAIFHDLLALMKTNDLNTTPLLDQLDKLYEQDDILFQINKAALTPTHKGPIIELIRDASSDLLEFIKKIIVLKSPPNPTNSTD